MDQKIRPYYFACGFLWFTLSGFEYVLEDISSIELHQRSWEGSDELGNSSEWLLDELFQVGNQIIGQEEAKAMRAKIENLADPKVIEWAEELHAAARDLGEIDAISEEILVYYFACGWSLRSLSEFDRLLRDMNSPELRQRYQEASAKFENLAEWLRNELSWVVNRPRVSEEETETLQAAMETLTDQLATEWREKVHELAKA